MFLDIGAHDGETAAVVARPEYRFDRIVCFEPASACIAKLEKLRTKDKRIEVCPFGLAGRNGKVEMHGAGSVGGSILGGDGPTETIDLVDAAQWFRSNLDQQDFIVVKANCEGAEVEILERLLDDGLIGWAVSFLVMFDIRMFPGGCQKEVEIRRRLKKAGMANVCFSDDVMIGNTHAERLAHWLGLFGIDRSQLSAGEVRRLYDPNFRKYAARSGRRQRAEHRFKDALSFASWPAPVQEMLRWGKRQMKLGQER